MSLGGQVLCVQAHWAGKVAYSGLFVWLCKSLGPGERLDRGVAGLLDDTCAVLFSLSLPAWLITAPEGCESLCLRG